MRGKINKKKERKKENSENYVKNEEGKRQARVINHSREQTISGGKTKLVYSFLEDESG